MIEKLLQSFVGEVDTNLLETVELHTGYKNYSKRLVNGYMKISFTADLSLAKLVKRA